MIHACYRERGTRNERTAIFGDKRIGQDKIRRNSETGNVGVRLRSFGKLLLGAIWRISWHFITARRLFRGRGSICSAGIRPGAWVR